MTNLERIKQLETEIEYYKEQLAEANKRVDRAFDLYSALAIIVEHQFATSGAYMPGAMPMAPMPSLPQSVPVPNYPNNVSTGGLWNDPLSGGMISGGSITMGSGAIYTSDGNYTIDNHTHASHSPDGIATNAHNHSISVKANKITDISSDATKGMSYHDLLDMLKVDTN